MTAALATLHSLTNNSQPIKIVHNPRCPLDMLLPLAAERLAYEPDTGLFRWKVAHGLAKPGDLAGAANTEGYLVVRIAGRRLRLHRLAYYTHNGLFPPPILDHINRDRSDNRASNIRPATQAQNLVNTARRRSASGRRGVSWYAKHRKWRARIKVAGKKYSLGYFSTAEEASAAYIASMTVQYGEFFNERDAVSDVATTLSEPNVVGRNNCRADERL
jgi:hypothetical protein